MKHLKQQQAALDELAQTCRNQPTALLCYEADYTHCHRTYVARALAQRSGSQVRCCAATSRSLSRQHPA